jgi:hypothetical protein
MLVLARSPVELARKVELAHRDLLTVNDLDSVGNVPPCPYLLS